jgi:hypothetical protein
MKIESKKVTTFVEYVAESSTACLVTMVQGNMLALTVSHLVIASQTGVIAGVLAATGLIIAKTDKRWIVSLVLGIATAVVDYFVHPGMFGPVAAEAIVTGVAAGVLSYLVGILIRRMRDSSLAT